MQIHPRNGSVADRHALVWGARGFIGWHLVEDLVTRGWRVRVLTRSLSSPAPSWVADVEWVELEGHDRARAFDRAVRGVPVIFNLAGSSGAVASNSDPVESLESNCRLQLELLAACARAGERPHVVFASSRLVYAQAGRRPISEHDAVAPLSMYAAHKLCVEHYHQIVANRGHITFTLCRISNPYGLDRSAPYKGYGFINALIQKALTGHRLTLFGTGSQLRDYLYIDDLITMLRLTAERREVRNQVLNLAFGSSVSIRDAANQIQAGFGGPSVEYRPWPPEYEAVESGDFVADISKARALLAFSPEYPFKAGLANVRARAAGDAAVAASPIGHPLELGVVGGERPRSEAVWLREG